MRLSRGDKFAIVAPTAAVATFILPVKLKIKSRGMVQLSAAYPLSKRIR